MKKKMKFSNLFITHSNFVIGKESSYVYLEIMSHISNFICPKIYFSLYHCESLVIENKFFF